MRKLLNTLKGKLPLSHAYAHAYIGIAAISILCGCLFFSADVIAQSSSTSYRLDYERNVSDAGYKQSSSYNLVGAITNFTAEGSSSSYFMRNVYAGLGTVCGDGVIEGNEQCEGSNFNGLTCSSFGYDTGYLTCVNCQIVVSNCYNEGGGGGGDEGSCGNGIKDGGEQCDDGNNISGDGCSSGCRLEDWRCGNGIREGDEECDDGNVNLGDGCTPDCEIETPEPVCGDGIKEGDEECDDGNTSDGDFCTSECKIPEPVCGNGIKEEGESCDDGNSESGDGCDTNCEFEFGFPIPVCGNGILEMNEYCDDGNLIDGDGCNAICAIEEEKLVFAERPIFIIEPEPVTLFPELRPAAQEPDYYQYHFESVEQRETITTLDETPFIVTEMEENAVYEMVTYDKNGEVVSRQGVQADNSGILKAEVLTYLNYDYYSILFYNNKHELVKEFNVNIEDREYRLHESLAFDNTIDRETICLGSINREEGQFLDGKGKPENQYFAYFQSLEKARWNRVNPTTIVKVNADIEGNYRIPIPENLKNGAYHIDIVQVYSDGKISRNKRYVFSINEENKNIWILVFIALMTIAGRWEKIRNLGRKAHKKYKRRKHGFRVKMLMSILLLLSLGFGQTAKAAVTTPQLFIYEGKLLDAANSPITTSQTFRFSLWSSQDFVTGDVDATGAIDTGVATYSGWQEVQTVTPNNDGTFFFELGSITPLPDMDFSIHKFLQVEIKAESDADTAYELMDPTGDNGADTDDRQTIGSSPFTSNADFIDNAEVGTSEGDIATLSTGDVWDINFIPGGTNADSFVIDYDDSVAAGDISLQFGNTVIGALLKFSTISNWFEFSDDVSFGKNEIKNVAIDNLASAPIAPATGQIYHNTTDGNTYIWNGTEWEDITAQGTDDLDTVYAEDADKIMEVDNLAGLEFESTTIGNIAFDLQSTGDLVVQDEGVAFVTFTDEGTVGIGTDTPESILHVDSNEADTEAILTLENTGGDFQIFRTDSNPEGVITGSVGDFAIDSTNGTAYIKNSGDGTNTGWVQFGGEEEKQMAFNVEYEDTVTTGDGSDNRGTLKSQYVDDGTRKYNFAEWTTARGTIQDIDIIYSIRLPDDFISFTSTPLELVYKTSDADTSNNKVDVYLYDATNTAVSLTNASDLVNAAWTTASITMSGTPTFSAGDVITLIVKLSTTNIGDAKVADVIFNYNGL